jgi:hypothetical protein
MTFRVTGLSPEPFRRLFGLPDEALAYYAKRGCYAGRIERA